MPQLEANPAFSLQLKFIVQLLAVRAEKQVSLKTVCFIVMARRDRQRSRTSPAASRHPLQRGTYLAHPYEMGAFGYRAIRRRHVCVSRWPRHFVPRHDGGFDGGGERYGRARLLLQYRLHTSRGGQVSTIAKLGKQARTLASKSGMLRDDGGLTASGIAAPRRHRGRVGVRACQGWHRIRGLLARFSCRLR